MLEKPKFKWVKGSVSDFSVSKDVFANVLESKLLSLSVPSSPNVGNTLNISLSFKNTNWFSVVAVEEDGVWHLFKNGKKHTCVGWVKSTYAMREFLVPRFVVVCEILQSEHWCHSLVCCSKANTKRNVCHCKAATLCFLSIRKFREAGLLSQVPHQVVLTTAKQVWNSRHSKIWTLCDL